MQYDKIGHKFSQQLIDTILVYYGIRTQQEIADFLNIKKSTVKYIVRLYSNTDKRNKVYTEFYDGLPLTLRNPNSPYKYYYIRLNEKKWIPLSLYVIQKHLGRELTSDEMVIHVGSKQDDRLENLRVVTKAEMAAMNRNPQKARNSLKEHYKKLKTRHIYGLKGRSNEMQYRDIVNAAKAMQRDSNGKFIKGSRKHLYPHLNTK
jgi:hypothetical protein